MEYYQETALSVFVKNTSSLLNTSGKPHPLSSTVSNPKLLCVSGSYTGGQLVFPLRFFFQFLSVLDIHLLIMGCTGEFEKDSGQAIKPAELWGWHQVTEFQDIRRKEREGHPEVVGGKSQGFRRAGDTVTPSPSYLLEN